MTAVAFDTLKLAHRLESAGFTHEQADGAAAALAETFSGEIATKSDITELKGDIAALRTELRGEIVELRAEFKGDIAGVQGEIAAMQGEIAALRAEVKGDIAKLGGDLRGEIAALRSSTAQWIISAVFVNIVAVIAAVAAVWQLAHR